MKKVFSQQKKTVNLYPFDTEKEGCCLLDAAVMLRYNHDAFYM